MTDLTLTKETIVIYNFVSLLMFKSKKLNAGMKGFKVWLNSTNLKFLDCLTLLLDNCLTPCCTHLQASCKSIEYHKNINAIEKNQF